MPHDVIRKHAGAAAYVSSEDILNDLNTTAFERRVTFDQAVILKLISLLEDIRLDLIEPPRYPPGNPELLINVVLVQTAGIPQQGPDTQLPPGYTLAVRQRAHTTGRTGYIALSRAETMNTLKRIELRDNLSISVRISNLNQLWFDASANNTYFELVVEYGRQTRLSHLI